MVEVPLNSPQPFDSIGRVVKRFGDKMLVGAGTVMSTEAAQRVADVGGKLIVTPHADVTVTAHAKASGMFAVPGFFTPTEAFALLAAGADALKLFPAEAVAPAVLSAMRAVFPPDTRRARGRRRQHRDDRALARGRRGRLRCRLLDLQARHFPGRRTRQGEGAGRGARGGLKVSSAIVERARAMSSIGKKTA